MKIRNLEEHIKAAFEQVSEKVRLRNANQRRRESEIVQMLEVLRRRLSDKK